MRKPPESKPPEWTKRATSPSPTAGFTLLELSVVLAIVSVVLAAAAPRARNARDRIAVRGAREAAAALLARARARAVLRGGAEIEVDEESGRIVVRTDGLPSAELSLGREFGVTVELPGPSRAAVLRYDALGVGRLANRTVHFRRGEAEASLIVSSYGRVRRR